MKSLSVSGSEDPCFSNAAHTISIDRITLSINELVSLKCVLVRINPELFLWVGQRVQSHQAIIIQRNFK